MVIENVPANSLCTCIYGHVRTRAQNWLQPRLNLDSVCLHTIWFLRIRVKPGFSQPTYIVRMWVETKLANAQPSGRVGQRYTTNRCSCFKHGPGYGFNLGRVQTRSRSLE